MSNTNAANAQRTTFQVVFWRPSDNLRSLLPPLWSGTDAEGEPAEFLDATPDELLTLARNTPGVWFAIRQDPQDRLPYLMVNRGSWSQR